MSGFCGVAPLGRPVTIRIWQVSYQLIAFTHCPRRAFQLLTGTLNRMALSGGTLLQGLKSLLLFGVNACEVGKSDLFE